jgi:hypothetical protein
MDTATLLIGFAEIAISMAGFTAIATIIVRISDTTTQNLLAVRLKMALIFSVHLIIISLAPFVLYQFDPVPERYWRSSALVSFVSTAPVAYIGFFQLLPKTLKDPKNFWWQTTGTMTCSILSFVTGLLTIYGTNACFWYCATLSLVLGTSLIMLVGLVLAFLIFDIHQNDLKVTV